MPAVPEGLLITLLQRQSPVRASLDPFVLDHLQPISVWVQDKSNVLHSPFGQPLLPLDAFGIQELASFVKVINRDTNVSKPLWLRITVMVDLSFLLLRAYRSQSGSEADFLFSLTVVPRELQ
jgi:hypothetical protein